MTLTTTGPADYTVDQLGRLRFASGHLVPVMPASALPSDDSLPAFEPEPGDVVRYCKCGAPHLNAKSDLCPACSTDARKARDRGRERTGRRPVGARGRAA